MTRTKETQTKEIPKSSRASDYLKSKAEERLGKSPASPLAGAVVAAGLLGVGIYLALRVVVGWDIPTAGALAALFGGLVFAYKVLA